MKKRNNALKILAMLPPFKGREILAGIITLLSFIDPFVFLLSLRPKYRMGTISRFLAFPSPPLAAGVSHAEIDGG